MLSLHNFATVRFHSSVSVKTRQWRWCPSMAYAVGLIATDGNLGLRRPIVSFTSSEVELIQLFSGSLQISPRMYQKRGGFGSWTNQVAIWDPELHEWLLSIGLTPRKTLRLGGIAVPDAYLAPLARGLLDGDGSVLSYWHVPNRRKYPRHRNLRLTTRFYSASLVHVEWLARRLSAVLGVRGSVGVDSRDSRHNPLYHLQFAKGASRALLTVLYSDTAAPRLARKHDKWLWFLENESALSSCGQTRR